MAVEFWAALAGAAVGGGASLAGSIIVNRREVRRAARLRLHDDLLPALRALVVPMLVTPEVFEAMAAVRRAAVVAGRDAVDHADQLRNGLTRLTTAHSTVDWGTFNASTGEYVGGSGQERYQQLSTVVEGRILAFADWTARKIL